MSELQDALSWMDSGAVVIGAKHILVLAEAARRVANLDYQKGADAGEDWIVDLVEKGKAGESTSLEVATVIIHAALGITTEDREEQA